MTMTAIITGAGSGVGQATALALAELGWSAAIIGRRKETLDETMQRAGDLAFRLTPYVCDIGDSVAVAETGKAILEKLGNVDVLVNAAGTNAPKRSLEVLSIEDYRRMIDTNLNGAYFCVQAVLPHMRARGTGTIVNIISDAAKQASPKAGPAYSMSKAGMVGLTQAINAEERARGIRACAILPGDIDTPLLNKRPVVPDSEARSKMMKAEDIAQCVIFCVQLPPRVIVEELLVRPR
jgi:NAD(P)-dependent dehydrogenase (short-subunit alcohol dehydrogenase family)